MHILGRWQLSSLMINYHCKYLSFVYLNFIFYCFVVVEVFWSQIDTSWLLLTVLMMPSSPPSLSLLENTTLMMMTLRDWKYPRLWLIWTGTGRRWPTTSPSSPWLNLSHSLLRCLTCVYHGTLPSTTLEKLLPSKVGEFSPLQRKIHLLSYKKWIWPFYPMKIARKNMDPRYRSKLSKV